MDQGKALFVGHSYIDVTFLTDYMPQGDEKYVAEDYAVSFGGNAVAAAFCCAHLGLETDLLCTVANDWPGRMFQDMVSRYGLVLHPREVARSSVSLVRPWNGKRSILRGRDAHYLHPFPVLNVEHFRALHLDGHQPDAALHYATECRKKGILTSLDGGRRRDNMEELLDYIDVAVVSELFCQEMGKNPREMLDYLRDKGCKVGAVTQGSKGVLWYDGTRSGRIPAFPVPMQKNVDTNGAGDIFHGAYIYSYLTGVENGWGEHFAFASVAAALSIQHLGIEASLPRLENIQAAMSSLPIAVGQ